tara:strand:+ start:151570 stop:152133 length:564 start_codon:yes stop_codon:yes gene_type:complete
MSVSDDEPPTIEELAEATALASRVDDLLAGQAMPAVLNAEERELAELGSMIHASYNPVSLDAERQASLIEAALAQGAGVASGGDELAQARAKRIARWPFAVGGLVAAAAVALLMFRPSPKTNNEMPGAPVAQMMKLPEAQQSRPGDALIGEIAREDRAAAGGRIDRLYSNRLSGYRNLQYRKFVGER